MRSHTENAWKNVAAGALAGLAASWVMNQVMKQVAKAMPQPESGGGDDATVKTAAAIAHTVNRELTQDDKKWAGPAVHYAFGTLTGAAYGALVSAVPTVKAGWGTLYGGAVWLAADEAAVPAFGLSQSPARAPASSHAQALGAHLVYGFTTEILRRTLLGIHR